MNQSVFRVGCSKASNPFCCFFGILTEATISFLFIHLVLDYILRAFRFSPLESLANSDPLSSATAFFLPLSCPVHRVAPQSRTRSLSQLPRTRSWIRGVLLCVLFFRRVVHESVVLLRPVFSHVEVTSSCFESSRGVVPALYLVFQVTCTAPLSVILLNGSIQCVRGPHACRR